MLSATWPSCVDLSRLPGQGPLRNVDHAVVDGDSFDGAPTPEHTVREEQDPRTRTDAAVGARYVEEAAREAVAEIRAKLLSSAPPASIRRAPAAPH